jgi:hypothetical protein
MHARNTVTERDDASHFGDVNLDGMAADLVANDLGDLFSSDVHLQSSAGPIAAFEKAR